MYNIHSSFFCIACPVSYFTPNSIAKSDYFLLSCLLPRRAATIIFIKKCICQLTDKLFIFLNVTIPFFLFFFSPPTNQPHKYSMYYHMKQRKALNPNWKVGTKQCLAFLLEKWLHFTTILLMITDMFLHLHIFYATPACISALPGPPH